MKKQLKKQKNKKRHGFTLVELIGVMVLLGILAAVMIPRFSHLLAGSTEKQVMQDAATVAESVTAAGFMRDLKLESWVWVDQNFGPDWGYYSYDYSFYSSDMKPGEWGFVRAEDLVEYLPEGFPIAYGPKLNPGEYSVHILCNKAYPGATTYINGSSIKADLGTSVTIDEGSRIIVVDYMSPVDNKIYTMMFPKTPNTFWPFSSKNFFKGYFD